MTPSRDIARLIEIMAALRTPRTGCPWDLEQNFATIAPYTLEEAYEVADAIARDDLGDLEEELGDLLLQVVFHARMAQEQGAFDFGDVVEAITTKLIRRHPHVFGDKHAGDPEKVKGLWEEIKAQEKAAKAARGKPAPNGALAGVPVTLPALTRALKLQSKAGKVGFDWNDPRAVLRKIREEADEIEAALDGNDPNAAAEVGDLLFAAVNLARHLDADPEALLRQTNLKFERRFSVIEHALAANGKTPAGRNARGNGRPLERGESAGSSGRKAVGRYNIDCPRLAKRPFSCRKQESRKARAYRLGFRRIDPHGHTDTTGPVIGRLVQNFGMTMKRTHARPVRGVEHELDQNAPGRELRLDRRVERIDPLPGDRRHQHRPALLRTTLGEITQPLLGLGVEPVDLVPDFDERRLAGRLAVRIDSELAQNVFDVL